MRTFTLFHDSVQLRSKLRVDGGVWLNGVVRLNRGVHHNSCLGCIATATAGTMRAAATTTTAPAV
jgi:hypothetical protein